MPMDFDDDDDGGDDGGDRFMRGCMLALGAGVVFWVAVAILVEYWR